MPIAAWHPDYAFQVAFNADPNDATAVPTWTDLTARLRSAGSLTRGRQYELDQNQASAPTFVLDDIDEYLNPGNPSSPYAPNVVPYRQHLWQAMYPNGGTGNLLNTGAQGVSYDPSFESYTTGAAVTWITAVGGTTPVVGTTTPHAGTKDLTWTVVNGATVQGVSLTVPCIPGRQYTCSAYVRQSSASTQQITIVGVATGTSTATTGTYVRLTVTFTATQPTHTLQVATTGTAVAGTVLLDDVQHEPGAAASTATTSGPVVYGLSRGYVERWPSTWDHGGFRGRAEITCVDAFGPLNKISLWTEFRNAVLAKSPDYYWPLSEPQGATSFAEASGNNGPLLPEWASPAGGGTAPAAGTASNLVGDPNGTGVKFTQGATGASNDVGTLLGIGPAFRTASASFPASATGSSWGATFLAWVDLTYPTSVSSQFIFKAATFLPTNAAGQNSPGSLIAISDGSLDMTVFGPNFANIGTGAAHAVDDGKGHLLIGTVSQTSGGNTVLTIYLDGAVYATATYTTASVGLITSPVLNIMVGGRNDGTFTNQMAGGVIAHVALYSRVLGGSEITDLWNAAKGYPGETSGGRITRYLGYDWTGPASIDTGQSVMGVSALGTNTKTLAACQDVTTTENGNLWVDARGNTTFAARTDRYLATTSKYTFGENAAGGELPYLEGIGFDEDPTLIYDRVTVNNSGGVTAVAANPTTTKKYFPNDYSRDINVLSDNEAIDHANYLLNQHDTPQQRVASIVLDPAGNTTLWPVVLGIEVGVRVTVKRRAKAANGGAGLTMSHDYFVEQISHDGIDMATGAWQTTLQMSPVDRAQVWILGDATYGVLDSTTILAF